MSDFINTTELINVWGLLTLTAYLVLTFQSKFITSQLIFKETPSLKVLSVGGLFPSKHTDTEEMVSLLPLCKTSNPRDTYLIFAISKLEAWLKVEGELRLTASQRLSPTSNTRLVKVEARRRLVFGSDFSTEEVHPGLCRPEPSGTCAASCR